MSVTRSRFILITLLFAIVLGAVATTQPAHAQNRGPDRPRACACLEYFVWDRGFPGGVNSAADYYNANSKLFKKITPSTSKPKDLEGAGMIWARGVLGADSRDGHIATVTKASYNSKTKRWTIEFRDANSRYSLVRGPFTDNNCTNVAIRKIELTSLSGLTFFKKR